MPAFDVHPIDIAILLAYVVGTRLVLGWYFARRTFREGGTESCFLAGRRLRWLIIGLSFYVANMSGSRATRAAVAARTEPAVAAARVVGRLSRAGRGAAGGDGGGESVDEGKDQSAWRGGGGIVAWGVKGVVKSGWRDWLQEDALVAVAAVYRRRREEMSCERCSSRRVRTKAL